MLDNLLDALNRNAGAYTVLFSAVVAVSTVVYAVLTWRLASETTRMREIQTEPVIEIAVRPMNVWINFLRLHVTNIGAGIAQDVRFRFDVETGTGADLILKDFLGANFLQNGLRHLGPGQEMVSPITSFVESFDQKVGTVIVATVTYRGAKKHHEETFMLDFSEFRGLEQIGSADLNSIATSVQKIERELHHVLTGFRRVKIDTYNSADRQHERTAMEERWEAERLSAETRKKTTDSPDDAGAPTSN